MIRLSRALLRPLFVLCAAIALTAVHAAAGPDDPALPFLGTGGATYRRGALVLPGLPQLGDDALDDQDLDLDDSNWDERIDRESKARVSAIAFPDVGELLEGDAADVAADGSVRLSGDAAAQRRARRRIDAVRAAYSRRVRVELRILRPGSTDLDALDADGLLDAPPPDAVTVAHVSRELAEGAVWCDDRRAEETVERGIDVDAVALRPDLGVLRTGAMVAVSAAFAGRGRFMARIAAHVSVHDGDLPLEHDGLVVRAPRLRFLAFAVDAPVTPGLAGRLVANGGDRAERFVAVYRVTLREIPSAPSGLRALGVHGWWPLTARPDELLLGLAESLDAEPAGWHERPLRRGPPVAFERAAPRGVRLTLVHPGVVVAEGDEAALARLDDAVLDAWEREQTAVRATAAPDDDARIELDAFTTRAGYVAVGTCTPVAARANSEVSADSSFVAPHVQFLASGLFLRLVADDGLPRFVTERLRTTPPVRDSVAAARVTDEGETRETLRLSSGAAPLRRSVVTLASALGPLEERAAARTIRATPWRAPR